MKPMTAMLLGLALLSAPPLLLAAPPAQAADVAREQVARVAEQLRRAEAVREIKRLQHSYVHYLQLGLWDEAASLFARDGALGEGRARVMGPQAIAAHLRKTIGQGQDGIAQGRLHVDMIFSPVVTLSVDGTRGKGRWHSLGIDAHYGERADWSGAIQENVYVLEDGKWKFAMLHPYPLFAGSYEAGWKNVDPVLRAVPFHFSVDSLGIPSTRLQDGWTAPAGPAPSLADLERRVARLNDASQIENLQNAYGYYVDRRLWDDVTDLFAPDGVMEAAGDRAQGRKAIRAALEAVAPAGLRSGELNDRLQFDMVITVAPDGASATARGIELGMVGKANEGGAWTLATFENLYVKRDGKWMLAHMRLYPRARTDYAQGWAKSAIPYAPFGRAGPAVPARQAALQYPGTAFPALSFTNPVTDKAPAYPAGMTILPAPVPASATASPPPANPSDPAARLAEIERQLAIASAYDGAENVSTAYGYYIDEFLWRPIGDLFSKQGWKELSYVGTYVGNERVFQSLARRYGNGGRFVPSMAIHQKMQPVTTVAADGKSARIHLRLFQLGTSNDPGGAQIGGHYENGAVLEDGLWKISAMDLDYVWTGDLATGWTKADPASNSRFVPDPDVMKGYPPDGPLRGPSTAPWPDLLPVALHFRNPVSGRAPELLLPPRHF
ncbi:hypothetical protein SLG_12120 [Sphingobium sp. SYK-6]|uniref:nuclear transport factor 2 family protein n=1 Tax=Sphingobium sp. (strain NBRC 103272 / SYK-6) TaxID=627192 RepID=UPI00022771FF|nr:nuclear transport factor 2 family protein [Sphingobium sp. SYK-6]BAK65887.1 hypothetical protein SLG_12120 [Sphingobium sp. SYK-6]